MKTFNRVQRFSGGGASMGTYAVMFCFAAVLSLVFASRVQAYSLINSQLDMGERNVDVTSLQDFFAANPAIYPEGLVTGYFGTLTKASVLRFQSQYNLDQVGRVGPLTRDKINTLISAGGWVTVDVAGPAFYNVNQMVGSNSRTFSFNTTENKTARIVYYTNLLMFNEGDINSNGFGPIGGYSVASPNGMSSTHTITLPNLQSNTVYYYTIIATDAAGNVSVFGPNNSFRSN